MALNPALVQNASDHLDDVTRSLYKVLFKTNEVYIKNAAIYVVDVDSRLTSAEGTIKARMLNAIMLQIQKLGVGEVEIKADKDGLYYSQTRERQALITEAFYVLFDDLSAGVDITDGVIPSLGIYGSAAIGQRPCITAPCQCSLNPCTCGGITVIW